MQMHCRFLICASNGWPSTCNCKCSDSAEGEFKLVKRRRVCTKEQNSALGQVG